MRTIILPDGYCGHTVECEIDDPMEIDGDYVKLRVKGSTYLFRWCDKKIWEKAIKDAECGKDEE